MNAALIAAGILLLALVAVDVLKTTLGNGGGPFTIRFTGLAWSALLRLHRGRHHRLLAWGGVLIMFGAVVLWTVVLWGGWTLLFLGGHIAVVEAQTRQPADLWHHIYFTGTTLFTLGPGDYLGDRTAWQILTAVAAYSGLFVITLAITYLTPVVQAATQKRQIAVQILSLGGTPCGLILDAWDGHDCHSLGQYLPPLATELTKLEQRHLAYPVLHYFHSLKPEEAASLRVAALDEALTILEHGLAAPDCLPPRQCRPVRRVITRLLETLDGAHIAADEEVPPIPSLAPLRAQGIPVVDDATFEARVAPLEPRRRLLAGLVTSDGWSWDDIRSDAAS